MPWGRLMKNIIISASICLSFAAFAGTATAGSQITSQSSSSCFQSCAAVKTVSKRRIVRIQPVSKTKIATSQVGHGKYLAKLNHDSKAYGKVLVPVKSTSRINNAYRP